MVLTLLINYDILLLNWLLEPSIIAELLVELEAKDGKLSNFFDENLILHINIYSHFIKFINLKNFNFSSTIKNTYFVLKYLNLFIDKFKDKMYSLIERGIKNAKTNQKINYQNRERNNLLVMGEDC